MFNNRFTNILDILHDTSDDVFVDQSSSMRFEDVFLFAINYFIEQAVR